MFKKYYKYTKNIPFYLAKITEYKHGLIKIKLQMIKIHNGLHILEMNTGKKCKNFEIFTMKLTKISHTMLG